MPQGTPLITQSERSKLAGVPVNAAHYGLSEDASGAANLAALSDAVEAALASMNRLYIPAGTYSVTSTGLSFPAPLEVFGAGMTETILQPSANSTGTFITCNADESYDWATPLLFKKTGYLHDFAIERPASLGDPTAGNGLALTTSGQLHFGTIIERVSIGGFWVNLMMDTCGNCIVHHCKFNNFRQAGIWHTNTVDADQGDNVIHDNWFGMDPGGVSGAAADAAGVYIEGGSGVKVGPNNKFLFLPHGVKIYFNMTTAANGSSNYEIFHNYFDGFRTSGIKIDSAWGRSGSGAGIWDANRAINFPIKGNNFFPGPNVPAIDIAALSGAITHVYISGGNNFRATGIKVSGYVDWLSILGNSLYGSGANQKPIEVTTVGAATNYYIGDNDIRNDWNGNKPDLRPDTSLMRYMTAYWRFEEATGSGNRADATGRGNTAVPSASVTAGTGIAGNCATASGSNRMDVTSAADIQLGDTTDTTMFGWVRFSSIASYQQIIGKWDGTNGFIFGYDHGGGGFSSDAFFFLAGINGHSNDKAIATSFGAAATGQWYFFVLRHYYGKGLSISINGIKNTVAWPWGFSTSSAMEMMASSGGSPMTGLLDEVGIMKGHIMSDEEERFLYAERFGQAFDSGGRWDK